MGMGPGQTLVSFQAAKDRNEPPGDLSPPVYDWGTCSKGKRLTDFVTEVELVGFVRGTGWFPRLNGAGSTNGTAEVPLGAERGLELRSKGPFKLEIMTS